MAMLGYCERGPHSEVRMTGMRPEDPVPESWVDQRVTLRRLGGTHERIVVGELKAVNDRGVVVVEEPGKTISFCPWTSVAMISLGGMKEIQMSTLGEPTATRTEGETPDILPPRTTDEVSPTRPGDVPPLV